MIQLNYGIAKGISGINHVIDFMDKNIPCEYTMTGDGFRQDLYALESVWFANPTLIPEGLACLSETIKYSKVIRVASVAGNEGFDSFKAITKAATGKGNFSIGTATKLEADTLGKAWVGEGYRMMSNGKGLVSADGLRIYRFPSEKQVHLQLLEFKQTLSA